MEYITLEKSVVWCRTLHSIQKSWSLCANPFEAVNQESKPWNRSETSGLSVNKNHLCSTLFSRSGWIKREMTTPIFFLYVCSCLWGPAVPLLFCVYYIFKLVLNIHWFPPAFIHPEFICETVECGAQVIPVNTYATGLSPLPCLSDLPHLVNPNLKLGLRFIFQKKNWLRGNSMNVLWWPRTQTWTWLNISEVMFTNALYPTWWICK